MINCTSLEQLIQQAQEILDAIANHPEYRLLCDNDHLTDLDVSLGDAELFLTQLNAALGQATESQADGGFLPSFNELFSEESLSNPLQTPERRKLTLPSKDPKVEAELEELDRFFNGNK
jgi:hypothetical protein